MISIVIPAYNEEKAIASCLDGISRVEMPGTFEVIVVDNNSTDRTCEVVRKYMDVMPVRIVKEKKKGRGAARARGFEDAKGSIIFSTDADTIVPKKWVVKMLPFFKKRSVVAVTGTGRIKDIHNTSNTMFNIFQPNMMRAYKLYFGHYWLTGFNFAIRKKTYVQSGGFDKNLNAIEDIDLAKRVADLGEIAFTASVPCYCSGRRYKKGLVRGLFSYVPPFLFTKVAKHKVHMGDDR